MVTRRIDTEQQDIVSHRCIERGSRRQWIRCAASGARETPHGGECTETSESILSKRRND